MGAAIKDFEPGGGGTEGIGSLIQSGSAGGVGFRGRDVGPDPPSGEGPGQISTQGQAVDHRETAEAAGGGELGLPSAGDGNVGSRLIGDWGLRHKEAEYGRAIYCNATDSEPL